MENITKNMSWSNFFVILGYQVFGNITRTEENFIDLREVIEEEGGIFLGELKV